MSLPQPSAFNAPNNRRNRQGRPRRFDADRSRNFNLGASEVVEEALPQPAAPSPWRWMSFGVWRLDRAFEQAKAAGRPEDDTRIRIFFVLALFFCSFLTLAVGATKAALFPGIERANGFAWGPGSARADLVDRNGAMLAANLLHYGLYVDPREIWDTPETRRALRTTFPGLSSARIERALHAKRRTFLVGGLTPQVRAQLHDLGLPGLSFEPEQRRVYPLGQTAAHLIGFSDTGGQGLAGAELAFNDQIRAGAANQTPTALSIDLRIQAALEDELFREAAKQGVKGAVGIVTNVHTGEILGVASYPTFDPNRAGRTPPDALINRAAASVYEMGSTFKVFTVALGLDSGTATVATTFDASIPLRVGGRTIHDYHAENRVMTVEEIFTHSSNIGTTKLAMQAGAPTVTRYFKRFGLLEPAPVELEETAKPILPRKWDENAIASSSFGHAISVSPMALTAGMGALLNGGRYVPLTIRPMKAGARPNGQRIVSEDTSRAMLELMRANTLRGSGTRANPPGLRAGGKTGSAEKVIAGRYDRTKLVASYASVFPTDGPLEADRYFVLILMDEPNGTPETFGLRTGGFTAAPAAGRVINRIAPILGVERKRDIPEQTTSAAPVDQGEEH